MNRREFLAVTSGTGIGLMTSGCWTPPSRRQSQSPGNRLHLLPYPQQIEKSGENLPVGGTVSFETLSESATTRMAVASLKSFLLPVDKKIPVRLGTMEDGYNSSWLTPEENQFLAASATSPEASIVKITRRGITVVGKGKAGMLYGVQTVNQLILQAARERRKSIPCLTIRDWPDMRWRCLSPTLTWYSGWNRLEGYDLCNWSEGEWKWLADWSLLHKCNAWAVCMYGYWPFTLPG
ncbi:MAG: glycoside hydrolase family 20 zincin-like fold domain-containing protein, partial [Verrucomicrobiota bacterium]